MCIRDSNNILWKPTDDLNTKSLETKIEELRTKIEHIKKESKLEKNLEKYQQAQKLEKEVKAMSYKTKIGGQLRNNNNDDEVRLNKVDIDIPKPEEALKLMNEYLSKEKVDEFNCAFQSENVIEYISYCVKETTKLIKIQPFFDGNKRTFRALLNLMFKAKGLPPVYIRTGEREAYKKALYNAMKYEDYSYITDFYLFKICDSIYELDVEPYKEKMFQKNAKGKMKK